MIEAMKARIGRVQTVLGLVAPGSLGQVSMHEHLHSDMWDARADQMIEEERPTSPERLQFLMNDAVPLLRECREKHGMNAYCDTTMPPYRAWPDVYEKVSAASGVQIIMSTGFYREIETGTYMITSPDRAIWPFVRTASVEELEEFCVKEIVEGIHGTSVRAGCIKLATSRAALTPVESKAFRAGAQAQIRTGVSITTHCTKLGAESSQLMLLDREGVDLNRVVIGHTAWHISDKSYRHTVMDWMKRGASFLPTNLKVTKPEDWRPMVESFHEIFAAGLGEKLVLGMDHGYGSEKGVFEPMWFMPPPPFRYLFDQVLPVLRTLGLTAEEERAVMETNPARLLAIAG